MKSMDSFIFEEGGEFRYFYGVYSTLDRATEIKLNLESYRIETETEEFVIEEVTLDEPTELYKFMTMQCSCEKHTPI